MGYYNGGIFPFLLPSLFLVFVAHVINFTFKFVEKSIKYFPSFAILWSLMWMITDPIKFFPARLFISPSYYNDNYINSWKYKSN